MFIPNQSTLILFTHDSSWFYWVSFLIQVIVKPVIHLSVKQCSDMLPLLKSLILKWGLLAQWFYWAKYLQAILARPAILLPGHGHFFIFLLSGYGQFMLSTSFSPLRGCWLLHYDLCPSYFHTHSDRLQLRNCWCVCIAYHGRIIPACCIVNYL